MSFVQVGASAISFSYPASVRALFPEETQLIFDWMHRCIPNSHLDSRKGELVFHAQSVQHDSIDTTVPEPELFWMQASAHIHEQLHYAFQQGWAWISLNKENALVAHLFFANGKARSFLCDPTLLFPLHRNATATATTSTTATTATTMVARPLPTPVWETPELLAIEELPATVSPASFFYAWASYVQSELHWNLADTKDAIERKKRFPKLYWFLQHALHTSLSKRVWMLV